MCPLAFVHVTVFAYDYLHICMCTTTCVCLRLHACRAVSASICVWLCAHTSGTACSPVCAHVGICVRTWAHGGPRASVPTNIYHVGGDGFLSSPPEFILTTHQ